MDAAGAQELLLPVIQPLELWQRTGRDKAYGPLMFRLTDRKETGFALAPTAEEVVTTTVGGEYGSYRDLPVNVYQIGWKYRDALRSRRWSPSTPRAFRGSEAWPSSSASSPATCSSASPSTSTARWVWPSYPAIGRSTRSA